MIEIKHGNGLRLMGMTKVMINVARLSLRFRFDQSFDLGGGPG